MPQIAASENPSENQTRGVVGDLFWNKLLARIIVTFVPAPERVDALPSPNLYFPHGASGAAVHQDQGSTCEARGAGTTGDGGEGEVEVEGEDRPDHCQGGGADHPGPAGPRQGGRANRGGQVRPRQGAGEDGESHDPG